MWVSVTNRKKGIICLLITWFESLKVPYNLSGFDTVMYVCVCGVGGVSRNAAHSWQHYKVVPAGEKFQTAVT